MNIKKIVMSTVLFLGISHCQLIADTMIWWDDNNGTRHFNNRVSIKTAVNMGVGNPKEFFTPTVETRVRIRQSWACLSLTKAWKKEDYKKLSRREALLITGLSYWAGEEIGFGKNGRSNDEGIQLLGSKNCSLLGLRERWTVEQQQKNGSWEIVKVGEFVFVK